MTKQEFLAMSLPYGLKVSAGSEIGCLTSVSGDSPFVFRTKYVGSREKGMNRIGDVKPILHPLSDLTKDQDKEDSLFWRLEEFACNTRDAASMYDHSGLNDINWIQEPFEIVMWLIKEHFDIAGLIEKGEAIDVNTLPENPYK